MISEPNERLEALLGKLDGLKKTGAGWMARCPAHDDNHASLSIGVGDDGRVLLKCHAGCDTELVVEKLDLTMADLMPPRPSPQGNNGGRRSRIVRAYSYTEEDGTPLYETVRFDPKGFAQRRKGPDGESVWNIKGIKRVLYRLTEVVAAREQKVRIYITEGEKDVESLNHLGLTATTNPGGASRWPGHGYADSLKEANVAILRDNDRAGQLHAQEVAHDLDGVASEVKVVELPNLPPKGDVSDWIAAGGTTEQLEEIVASTPIWTPSATEVEVQTSSSQGTKKARKKRRDSDENQADALIGLTEDAELFYDPDRLEPFATVTVGDHRQTFHIQSRGFRQWLSFLFWLHNHRAPRGQSIQEAIAVIAGRAMHDSPAMKIFVRIAKANESILIDLGDESRQAIEVASDGWRIIKDPPVKFIRPRGLLALPDPERGGAINELREFVNIPDDAGWTLFVSWIVAAMRPDRPLPVLVLLGEQGSAKSSTARIARDLIDPNTASLRRPPRNERDLMIAAHNSWVASFDNISGLPTWLSDSLCVLATGGGLTTRELFTDAGEAIFSGIRPIIINGIDDPASRADLLDRALLISLPPIPETRRCDEETLWKNFDAVRPRILGALLDAVVKAINNLRIVKLDRAPRMADFARWIVAAEPALPWESGEFLRVYSENREDATMTALEASPIAAPILQLAGQDQVWRGTAGGLLEDLNRIVDERTLKSKSWPHSARGLSGLLRRIAPELCRVGIQIEFERRSSEGRMIRICKTENTHEEPSGPSEPSSTAEQLILEPDGLTDDRGEGAA